MTERVRCKIQGLSDKNRIQCKLLRCREGVNRSEQALAAWDCARADAQTNASLLLVASSAKTPCLFTSMKTLRMIRMARLEMLFFRSFLVWLSF